VIVQIDNEREWIQWWIEDEEWEQYLEQWDKNNIPGYRPYNYERGVFEDEI